MFGITTWIKIAVVVALIGAAIAFVMSQRKDAANDALQKVERQNNAAGEKSEKWRSSWRDCVLTRSPAGVYDFETGECSRAP